MDQQASKFEDAAQSLRNMSTDELRAMIKKVPAIVTFADQDGKTLLLHTIDQWSAEKFDVLLNAGADAAVVDKNGRNALHYAARNANVHAAVTLVKKGIKPGVADADGNTPLHSLRKPKDDEQTGNIAMTAQALLFSDYSEAPLEFCDFSLLWIQNSKSETPVDVAFSKDNMPALSIFFKWASTILGTVNPNVEAQRVMSSKVAEKIFTHLKDNPEALIKLIDCYASDLHSLHQAEVRLANYKKKKKEMEERVRMQFQQKQ